MQTITFTNSQIEWTDETIEQKAINLSIEQNCYVTYNVFLRKVEYYLSNRKPTFNTYGAENCYRYHGGFFKNGKIVKPSPSFIRKFEFCPIDN